MDRLDLNAAFWRYVVNTKRAEQAGQLADARANLERAHRLASNEDHRMQFESWAARLQWLADHRHL